MKAQAKTPAAESQQSAPGRSGVVRKARDKAAFTDNRPEAIAQLTLAGAIPDSPYVAKQRRQLRGTFGDAAQFKEAHGNGVGLPDGLKSGVESLSGMSLDGVQVHYDSAEPAQVNALAYAQDGNIHLAPGQEQHLPHEAWHVVQQAQGRVKPTTQMRGAAGAATLGQGMPLQRKLNKFDLAGVEDTLGKTIEGKGIIELLKEYNATPDFDDTMLLEQGPRRERKKRLFAESQLLSRIREALTGRYPEWALKVAKENQELLDEEQFLVEKELDEGPVRKQKKEDEKLREKALQEKALEDIGGVGISWAQAEPKIKSWWLEMKQREKNEDFAIAFKDNRMTARQVNTGATARGGEFEVRNIHDRKIERTMKLARDVDSIGERNKPGNFGFNNKDDKRSDFESIFEPDGFNMEESQERVKGLFSLSATLLNGEGVDQKISTQLKPYEQSVVLFMPVPAEKDLQIISALSLLQGRDEQKIRAMRSMMTRMELAQSSDMGSTFVDESRSRNDEGEFTYGVSRGRILRKKGGVATVATSAELYARRTNALQYKQILKNDLECVNEIAMAYRKHESEIFPMLAFHKPGQGYEVVDDKLKPNGHFISDEGVYK